MVKKYMKVGDVGEKEKTRREIKRDDEADENEGEKGYMRVNGVYAYANGQPTGGDRYEMFIPSSVYPQVESPPLILKRKKGVNRCLYRPGLVICQYPPFFYSF